MSPRAYAIVIGLLCFVGLADGAYLTWDHFQAHADPEFAGGLCGEGGGCDISRHSAASEIPLGPIGPGLPISILAVAFYLVFGLLARRSLRRPEDREPRRLLLGLALLASLYSVALFALSLIEQGRLCEFCTVLYVVNLGLLAVSWARLGEPFGAFLRGVWGAILRPSAGVAAAVFAAIVVALYVPYALALSAADTTGMSEDVVAITTGDRATKGPSDAPIHIVEFADVECPHCRTLFETINEVQAARPDQVRVTFMHFPLDQSCNPAVQREFHRNACWLAAVADCADRQGRFFEVLGELFAHHRGLSRDAILGRVAGLGLGLDMDALRACVDDDATRARILSDIEEGMSLGVRGTPVFFVNGHMVTGARSRADLEAMLDKVAAESPQTGAR